MVSVDCVGPHSRYFLCMFWGSLGDFHFPSGKWKLGSSYKSILLTECVASVLDYKSIPNDPNLFPFDIFYLNFLRVHA